MIEQFVALLFFSRDYGHRAHLRTQSFSTHMALDTFYKELPEHIDTLVEMYQGRHGLIEISFLSAKFVVTQDVLTPIPVLEEHLKIIETTRYKAIDKADTALHNRVDEIVGLYLQTLYKLKNLK